MAGRTEPNPNPQGSANEAAVTTGPRRAWTRFALALALNAVGSVLAVGAAGFALSGLLIRPRLKRLSQLKSPHLKKWIERSGFFVRDIEFTSFDSTRLSGWWLEHSKTSPTIIVLHGVKQNRTDIVRAALLLRSAGFNTMLFDGRAHGNSGGKFVTYGFYERRDVEAAIEWLVNQAGVSRDLIGLAGESMGAAIALQVAASNAPIRAVWADSPFASLQRVASEFVQKVTHLPASVLSPLLWVTLRVANYRGKFDVETVDPLALAKSITCPVFMVHGTADQLISVEHSRNIYDALPGRKEIWLVEGAAHARAARFARSEYAKRIVRFFNESLKAPKLETEVSEPAA